jgi:glyoxylase-like metal-dependent hydrolase (beta-lactamase superfamily II)
LVKITEKIAAVEIAKADGLDTEVYILNCEGGLILIDVGFTKLCLKNIEKELGQFGKSWNDIKLVLITHAHGDHIENLKKVVNLSKGAEVMVGHGDAETLFKETGVKSDVELEHGDIISACGGIEVVHIPGHSDGNLSFYLKEEKTMIVGDTIFGDSKGNLYPPPEKYSKDALRAKIELKRLLKYDFEKLLLTHGKNILENGRNRVSELLANGS